MLYGCIIVKTIKEMPKNHHISKSKWKKNGFDFEMEEMRFWPTLPVLQAISLNMHAIWCEDHNLVSLYNIYLLKSDIQPITTTLQSHSYTNRWSFIYKLQYMLSKKINGWKTVFWKDQFWPRWTAKIKKYCIETLNGPNGTFKQC